MLIKENQLVFESMVQEQIDAFIESQNNYKDDEKGDVVSDSGLQHENE